MKARLAGVRRHWERWALAALLLVHVALGVYWSCVIPIWEAHDEDGHWFFVRFLATERRLPGPGERSGSENDEMHQPPLYYILAALPVALVDVSDNLILQYNPYMPWPAAQGGYNRFMHDVAAEAWPYEGTVLAIHLARWVSVVLGAVCLLFTYWTARALCPEQPWVRWGAVLIHAFWPQFRFSTAVINNDIMAAVWIGAATWLMVRLITMQRPVSSLLALGGAVGLALLSKNSSLGLLPAVVVVVLGALLMAECKVRVRLMTALGGALLMGAAAVGWWYAYNARTGAGMLGGMRSLESVMGLLVWLLRGGESGSFAYEAVLPALGEGLRTLWAAFGWNNVRFPMWFYDAAMCWALLGCAGSALYSYRCRRSRSRIAGLLALLLVAVSVSGAALFLYSGRYRTDLQGRYLLAIIPAVATLVSVGWTTLLPRRLRSVGWGMMSGVLALLALVVPTRYIQPAYALPYKVAEEQIEKYTPVHATFDDFVELVGYSLHNEFVDRKDQVGVTLLWRILKRAPVDYTMAVQVFAHERTLLGEVHRFPGQGSLTTSRWPVGTLFAEQVAIPVENQSDAGRLAWIELSLYDRTNLMPTEVRDQRGTRLGSSLRVGRIKVRGAPQRGLSVAQEGRNRFGLAIQLEGGVAAIQLRDTSSLLQVELCWTALDRPDDDYTVSLQLRDAKQTIVSQDDKPPLEGRYPTSVWEPGERVSDRYDLLLPTPLPAGEYALYVCMYEHATLRRLQVVDWGGHPLPQDEARLLTLKVRPDGKVALARDSSSIRVLDAYGR